MGTGLPIIPIRCARLMTRRLEKVGENSSNPFEGNANDVPISFIARRIEIEMRIMLGEQTDLKPIEAKDNILF